MTVTERLRELLDERGVEYRFNDAIKVFEWHYDGTDGEGFAHATEVNSGINIIACSLTPEQVIAATLGSADTYTREEVEGEFVSGYSLGLDMFDRSKLDFEKGWDRTMRHIDEEMAERGWVRKEAATSSYATADGTLHIRCLALPKRVEVTLPDERGRDVYSAKVHSFEPERETCRAVLNSEYRNAPYINDWIVCSCCGTKLAERFGKVWQRYCPNCGRKLADK